MSLIFKGKKMKGQEQLVSGGAEMPAGLGSGLHSVPRVHTAITGLALRHTLEIHIVPRCPFYDKLNSKGEPKECPLNWLTTVIQNKVSGILPLAAASHDWIWLLALSTVLHLKIGKDSGESIWKSGFYPHSPPFTSQNSRQHTPFT